jgi:hypothetical protein
MTIIELKPRSRYGGIRMLIKKATRVLIAVCVFLIAVTGAALAQGVARQDYSGLDKYITQGRPDNASFAGVRAAEFLTIPIGARGIAMGSAFSAVADDISAIWWNPAGLGFLQQNEVMMTMVDYTLDISYSYGAFAAPIADGQLVIGGFFGYLDVPDMEVTTVNSPDGTGRFFNAYDFQLGGSMAYNLSDRFVAGMNMKYVHQDVYSNTGGSAMAWDAGAIYHTELADREIKFAVSIQNLGTNIKMSGANLTRFIGPEAANGLFPDGYTDYSSDKLALSRRNDREADLRTHTYRLPTSVKIAVGYNVMTSEKANWLVSGEVWRPNNLPMTYSAGTEMTYSFNPVISAALRAGWKIQDDEYTESTDEFGYSYFGDDPTMRGLSFGGGIKRAFGSRFVEFSYAYRNKGRLSADNFFTVSFGF